MQIGIQTAGIFEYWGVDRGFRELKEAGFDCVDLGMDSMWPVGSIIKGERDFILSKPLDELMEYFRPYKEASEKYGVSVYQAHAPFPSYLNGKAELNEEIISTIEKCIAICGYLNCKYIIVHPAFNNYAERMEFDDEWNVNIALYSRLIPTLKKYGVICCLENMFTGRQGKIYEAICSDLNEAAAYIDELNGIAGEKRFAFCYDTGHGLLLGRDPYGSLLQIGDRVEALHIHDNDGNNDQHVMPYTGRLDWERFIKGLKAIGYQGALCFESGNSLSFFPNELAPQVLRLIAATGKYFADRLAD